MARVKKTEVAMTAGLMVLAFLVRWLPTLYPHFWFDEIFTISMANKSFGGILRLTAADMHPPLYYDWVKCLAALGNRLGGPFTTLAWLRLASVGPGVVTCALGWWVARRYWGPRPALWTLAAFVVAPALTFYSVDLRCYSTLHALLLGALLGLLRATDPRPGRRWPGMILWAVCSLTAFYTHSLSTLYIGMFGLIFLAEVTQKSELRRKLAWPGLVLCGVLALCCAPWIRLMFDQTTALNAETWFGWADWSKLRLTFFWYMPLGPLSKYILPRFWRLLVMWLLCGLLLLLVANAWRHRGRHTPGLPVRLENDRLLVYSGLLTLLPILAAFFLSYLHIAKVFLGYRYNLVPAPFVVLTLAGLILRIDRPRRRALAFGLLISAWMACSGLVLRQRFADCDILGLAAQVKPDILKPGSLLVWNNPTVLPWLGSYHKSHRIGSMDELLAGHAGRHRAQRIYLLTHVALDTNYCGLLHRQSYLLREIMKRQGIREDKIPLGAWDAVWSLTPADVPRLATALRTANRRIEARRQAIPGGQVLLADAELFTINGWGPLQFGPDLMPERWTVGPHQRLGWTGPHRPGRYRLKLRLHRPHPFPHEFMIIRYRLPGQRHWHAQRIATGRFTLEGEIQVAAPDEQLRLHLELPLWTPPEELAGTPEDRRPGVVFEALELHPLG